MERWEYWHTSDEKKWRRGLQSDNAEDRTDQDAEHGRGCREHTQENIPGDRTDLQRHVGTIQVQPPYGAEGFRVRGYRGFILLYPYHTCSPVLHPVTYNPVAGVCYYHIL